MTIGMSAENERDTTPERERQIHGTALLGRRRLLRGGLSAAPVIMTLASGPVSAGLCQTASAYGSLNPSGTRTSETCGGRSPAAWSTINNSYGPFARNTAFSAYFNPPLANDPSFKKVIDPNNNFDPVARNCLAAFLNASTAPPLTPAAILSAARAQAIWMSYKNTGFFEPTAGIQWGSAEIVAWITTTYS